jgi:glycosyltransferase involved in cell wall biosynthesis
LPANMLTSHGSVFPLPNELFKEIFREQRLHLGLKKHKIDVCHIPYYASGFSPRTKNVVTIHDVAPYQFPVYKGGFFRRMYHAYTSHTVKKADFFITDSQYSKGEIVKFTGLPREKIGVIPLAVDESFRPIVNVDQLESCRRKYNLPRRFILYVGGFDIRKNVENLLRAFTSLKEEDKMQYELVLGGNIPANKKLIKRGAVTDVLRLIKELEISGDVLMPGFIDENDLPAVYSLAGLFVFPSLYEGFGLPVLEALSCGTPVVASGSSSIPEIIDREELLFDPKNEGDIREKMRWMLEDRSSRKVFSLWGIERAKVFSWEKTAEKTLQVYERVYNF